jgi:hypothetical protein
MEKEKINWKIEWEREKEREEKTKFFPVSGETLWYLGPRSFLFPHSTIGTCSFSFNVRILLANHRFNIQKIN